MIRSSSDLYNGLHNVIASDFALASVSLYFNTTQQWTQKLNYFALDVSKSLSVNILINPSLKILSQIFNDNQLGKRRNGKRLK